MPRRRQTSAKREGRETGPLRSDRLPLSTLLASAAPPRGRALDEKPQPFGWGSPACRSDIDRPVYARKSLLLRNERDLSVGLMRHP